MFKTENLYQNDEAWKESSLGNSNETIGSWGCLLTSVTMMLNGIGYNETPLTVNEKMKARGGFQGALFIPSVLPYAFPNLVYKNMEPCESFPAPISRIDTAITAGKPVIVQVDWKKQAGVQTHFVLIKEKKGDDYVIYDPYRYGGDSPEKDVLLTQRYKYQGQKLESEISAVLWFDTLGIPSQPPEDPEPIPLPADSMPVYVAEDNLAFRTEPSVSGHLIKRFEGGVELKSLESASVTESKLGVVGEWLHAQDPDGEQAYTAAWYLSATKDTPPPSDDETTTPPVDDDAEAQKPLPAGALSLIPTDNVAFRKNTTISPETLIRRIPITEKVVSLEAPARTIEKVGVVGQWLNVRDKNETDGYIAAWYLKYESGSTAQDDDTTNPPAGDANTVKTTAQFVAFRSEPRSHTSTLIRYLNLGESLTLTEASQAANIGSNSEWLKVKDASGRAGYVAAWFVAR